MPCLATLGVTASQPPSRETFIAQGLQGNYVWTPSGEAQAVFASSPQKEVLMFETCPMYPLQYMWA